ncbi:methionyl-tRNA formyltransferase [Shewanella psychrophila]|uniref:Methionyl-tRNA formyltransferase n=1 Tax=Shewanella psychrophila TaxID=225848 RepID=A0A1S6HTL6_9GAMM|nr:formyltransferase family protein [Shewanella psychrophila]AQS38859.1 methionyl-tRNA formyltransferase [Shewanella psychrophila]
MRIGFIGCVQTSLMALETLLDINDVEVCAVVTREKSTINTDFADLSKICKSSKIPFHFENPKERGLSIEFLRRYNVDVIYCIGWSYLLSEELLALPPLGVIGFHPAKLPKNRGRHPIIWALALGLEETASTFFKMDIGADSGPILSQENILIQDTDDAKKLYEKILRVSKKQIEKFTVELANSTANFLEQDNSQATYWRKRSRIDGLIDFRMSAEAIHNLIRALAPPYPGAEFVFNGRYIMIISSTPIYGGFEKNIESGKVLEKRNNNILVKASGQDAIWLESIDIVDIEEGNYL